MTRVARLLWPLLLALPAAAQAPKAGPAYPPQIDRAQVEVYKNAGDARLKVWIVSPEGHSSSDRRPAIVFFFGGGWSGGTPKQFEQQSKHLAGRGMVAIMADYRVMSRHNALVPDCLQDAKSAIRWVRANAKRLGVDPNRIAAGGGSAGGHLAAATATVPGLEEPGADLAISSRPNALVLFNPALILAPAPEAGFEPVGQPWDRIRKQFGPDPTAVSPYHHIKKGAPPALILHGRADKTVPYQTAEAFAKKMTALGNRCELEGYDEQPHGFFNFGRSDNRYYEATLKRADQFLVSIGYLK
jgi:acetyl esterase/lipase